VTDSPEASPSGPVVEGRSGRVVDRGAIFAGWVGLGMALIIAISFELIVAVQALVFLAAPLAGVLIGFYANQRSERWRPRRRVFANAAYAGVVTGVGLAVIYVAIRLLFVYADSGYRPVPMGGQLDCRTGPDCTFARLVAEGHAPELAEAGITDAATFEAAVLREQAEGALWIVGLTAAGALVAGGVRAARRPPEARGAPPAEVALGMG
jgi:hypothetical protein